MGKVYLTGDCHADFDKLKNGFLPDEMPAGDDTVLVCGDFGIWHNNAEEKQRFKFLESLPYTVAFVDGNHENFDRLYSNEFEIVDFHGGKAHKILKNVYHLMRGYIFDFEGKKFFAFGGAKSHDIRDGILDMDNYKSQEEFEDVCYRMHRLGAMFRINHMSWWKEELPSEEEMVRGLKSLEACDYKVDYVITHCLPREASSCLGYHDADILTDYFSRLVRNGLEFDTWFAGHYHTDRNVFHKQKRYSIYYDQIERII